MLVFNDPHILSVPNDTEVIDSWCYNEKDIECIFIPKSVIEIQENAFRDCKNLREVIFEEGSRLKKIGESAFQNCSSLRNILLPEGLESIGEDCF